MEGKYQLGSDGGGDAPATATPPETGSRPPSLLPLKYPVMSPPNCGSEALAGIGGNPPIAKARRRRVACTNHSTLAEVQLEGLVPVAAPAAGALNGTVFPTDSRCENKQ